MGTNVKKLFIRLVDLSCLISLLIPPNAPSQYQLRVYPEAAPAIWTIYAVQLICVGVVFLSRRKLSAWFLNRAGAIEPPPQGDPIEAALCTVYGWFLIIFDGILPALLYLKDEKSGVVITFLLTMCCFTWVEMFFTPMYQILTGDPAMPPLRWRIPMISLAIFVYLVVKVPMPYTSQKMIGLYFLLLFTEMLCLIGGRIWVMKRRERRNQI